MRRSFVRLVLVSVLAAWVASIAVMYAFTNTFSWIDDRAQDSGIFLIHELLAAVPVEQRPARLAELETHTYVPLSLVDRAAAAAKLGRPLARAEHAPLRVSRREEWYFLAFSADDGVLAAGPINPSIPVDVFPIGAFLALLFVPIIAGLVTLRVERELSKVERASDALAVGELGARVENPRGPSVEIAARFNAMAERIEELVRSRDELVQAVSHELGSPVSRLRFQMELLEREPTVQAQERITAMNRELDALDHLVAELLGYVQSADVPAEPLAFDPAKVLADLAELAVLEVPEDHAVRVSLSVPPGIMVVADQRLFQRAVENLLRNAVRHAVAHVRLELTRDTDGVRVAVHDDGPGIPARVRDKVVLPFVRLEEDRSSKTGGVGLGLAIVRRIMRRHGGRLEIGDSPLGGALVATVWPSHAPALARAVGPSAGGTTAAGA